MIGAVVFVLAPLQMCVATALHKVSMEIGRTLPMTIVLCIVEEPVGASGTSNVMIHPLNGGVSLPSGCAPSVKWKQLIVVQTLLMILRVRAIELAGLHQVH